MSVDHHEQLLSCDDHVVRIFADVDSKKSVWIYALCFVLGRRAHRSRQKLTMLKSVWLRSQTAKVAKFRAQESSRKSGEVLGSGVEPQTWRGSGLRCLTAKSGELKGSGV